MNNSVPSRFACRVQQSNFDRETPLILQDLELEIIGFEKLGSITPEDLHRLRAAVHPDRWSGSEQATRLFARLGRVGEKPKVLPVKVGKYTLGTLLASGDFADIFWGSNPSTSDGYIIKVSRDAEGLKACQNEFKILQDLKTDTIYKHCFLEPVEQFTIKGKKSVSVLKTDNLFTLREIKNPSLNPRHVVWMFRRTMVALGYIRSKGYCHGAVTPDNIMFWPEQHTGCMVGFTHSVKLGEKLQHGSSDYSEYYPKSKIASPNLDIRMAGHSFLHLIEGQDTHRLIKSLFRSLVDAPAPDDAFRLNDELGQIANKVFGPPVFLELKISR